ncbi:type VII secretion protein EccC [Gordonia paraffinivorans]|uniref:type VII secretion protein EccCa n=1 Tax=Gordonia paraffinivorans TaxID=175628 RepID=UPI001C930EEF|nr:type VII secretion protein EccCa [Gordonia paraffinivorans]MBY4574118.1 type VII secretion protein EccC [Gordonia paraffinivorans]
MVATTEGFVRRPRVTPPRMPGGEVNIQAPPDVPRVVPGNLLVKLLPVVMIVAVVGMIALMMVTGGRNILTNPLFMMFPLMMLMSMFGMFAAGGRGGGKRAAELNEERKDYFRYLGQLRGQVVETVENQRAARTWSHPDPHALLDVIGSRRMWERRPADNDFAHVRVGVGVQRLATRLMPPETGPLEDIEPVSMVALRRFVRTHSAVYRLPRSISLRGFPAINIEGARQETRELVRAMLVELCAFHGPDHLHIGIVTGDPAGEAWDWAKWLPHVGHPTLRDGIGPMRMIYPTLADLENSLASDLLERGRFSRSAPPNGTRAHLVIVIDDGYVAGDERVLSSSGMEGVTVLDLTAPPDGLAARRGLQLVVRGGKVSARSASGVEEFADMDSLTIPEAEAIARRMARYRLATAATLANLESEATSTDPGLPALLGIDDASRFDPATAWRGRTGRDRLRVPIGYTPSGAPVELDIKESAHGGMGPHGLCIGATGSGKSEFLRTLVTAMLATHSPTELNLVLVDFKGGATFLGLESAPHVAAIITNLEQELAMVDRMKDALSGEMNRRQEVLRAAGNYANVGDYERARASGVRLEPMPALFIVVDEFSELLSQKPDFAELFVAIGRLGRSLHIHLLLASQRLEEGKLRGLDSHLSYRIGLKTFSANESRSVLGVPDAYHLPSVPGSAYLKCDSDDPVRFNTSYVSGPYHPPAASDDPELIDAGSMPRLGRLKVFTALPVPLDDGAPRSLLDRAESLLDEEPPAPESSADADFEPASVSVPTLMETIVSRIEDVGPPAHKVWLDPLDESPTVQNLLGRRDWTQPTVPGNLAVPIGWVDRPYDQRRDPLMIDLSGAAGNVAVVGGPQSGKSTTLRTIMTAMAATHTPEQVQFYCLDFGGGSLAGMAGLPHVGSVASRGDLDAVRRTVAEVASIVRGRELLFARLGLESMRDYRARRAGWFATGEVAPDDPLAEDRFGDVFLVLDGINVLRGELEALEEQFTAIASQGLSFGVHIIITATRWAEIRPAVRDLLGTRIELRLGDPTDSEMSRRAAAGVPQNRPGRGLTPDELHMLVALPRLDDVGSAESLPAGVAASVEKLVAAYPGRSAMAVRKLSTEITHEAVQNALAGAGVALGPDRVAIGVGEQELVPVVLDFTVSPHFMAFADVEHGKTNLLRTIVTGLVAGGTPDEVRIVFVDYRRTMLGVVDGDHLAGYASSPDRAAKLMSDLATYLKSRMPPEDVTVAQLKERSWLRGQPEIYLVVDDYDMVATASGNPLMPIVDLASHARDIGLHIVLARRSGGLGRALFDPLIARLKDLSCDMLLMSGDRDEGFITGRSRLQRLVPGRGELVSRVRPQEMIQVALAPTSE